MHTSLRETIETEVQTHVEDYGDLIVQTLGVSVRVPAANLPEALPFDANVASHDVMGAVDRYGADEAVLLAQKLRGLTVALQGTATAEANVEFTYNFGFDGGNVDFRFEDDVDEGYGSATEQFTFSEVNNDRLYSVAGKATTGFRDTSTGTGGGPESFFVSDETNYMTEIGVLPEVSARENLIEYWNVGDSTSGGPDDVSLVLYTRWQLYWLETDDEIEGRRIDVLE